MAYEERTIKELVRQLADDSTLLMRQEVELAKHEIENKLDRAKKDIVALLVGGAVLYAGFLVLLATVVLALANGLAPWLAALIVGGVVAIAGGLSALKGAKDVRELDPKPRQSLGSIRMDVQRLKEAAR